MISRLKGLLARRKRRLAIIAALFGMVGTAIPALASTGAYFSDTQSGDITGTIGSIHVATSGGSGANGADFQFANLLPGEPQTATVGFTNTGNNPQDVWVVFPNATALSALNNLGTYGEVHLVSDGTHLFDSNNLNDRLPTCGSFSPSGCWPLLSQYKVASNVAPGGTGSFTFSFNYAAKMTLQPAAGTTADWNVYPASSCAYNATSCPNGQTTVNPSDGTGSGLPFEVVATQVGQTP